MADIDFDQAVEDIWAASQGGAFPVQWKGKFDWETAYRICLAMIEQRGAIGDAQAGWKVGLTARAIREQQGATEPVFAVLYESGRWQSGVSHPYSDLMRPGWENELCLTMGATLKGPGVSEDDVKAAVAAVAPALEIIEQRPPVGKGSGFLSGADNGQQRSFIVGAETAYDASIHDLGKASVEVYVDGEFEEKAYGIEVMESSPLSSIVWLTEGLARFGHELTAGSVVMTGSFTKQYRFEGPVEVEARFEPFGTVTASFT